MRDNYNKILRMLNLRKYFITNTLLGLPKRYVRPSLALHYRTSRSFPANVSIPEGPQQHNFSTVKTSTIFTFKPEKEDPRSERVKQITE